MDNVKLKNKLQNSHSSSIIKDFTSSPPAWFKEYMEMFKEDIVTEVSHKVVKNIKKLLNESKEFKEFNQVRDHLHPSQFINHEYCNSYPKETMQYKEAKTMEGVKDYDVSQYLNTELKLPITVKREKLENKVHINNKQYQETIEAKLQEDKSCNHIPIEYLDKQLLLCKRIIDIQLQTLKKTILEKMKNIVDVDNAVKNSNIQGNMYSKEKRQYKKEKKAVEHEKNNSMSSKYLGKVALFLDKELSIKIAKIRLQEIALKEIRNTLHIDANSDKGGHEEEKQTILNTLKSIETELRMNCSITGHKVLDKTHVKDMFCSISDIDNISICSDISNVSDIQDDEHNFEVIQIPSNCNVNVPNQNNPAIGENFQSESSHIVLDNGILNLKSCKDENRESNRKSSSFEILSQIPSPPLPIYIEDHFSVTENDSSTFNTDTILSNDELDFRKNITFVNDICENGNNNMLNDIRKSTNINSGEKRSETHSIVEEGLYLQHGMKLKCNENQSDNINDLNIDVKNSHMSYPMKTQNSDTKQSEIPVTRHNRSTQANIQDVPKSTHLRDLAKRSYEVLEGPESNIIFLH